MGGSECFICWAHRPSSWRPVGLQRVWIPALRLAGDEHCSGAQGRRGSFVLPQLPNPTHPYPGPKQSLFWVLETQTCHGSSPQGAPGGSGRRRTLLHSSVHPFHAQSLWVGCVLGPGLGGESQPHRSSVAEELASVLAGDRFPISPLTPFPFSEPQFPQM